MRKAVLRGVLLRGMRCQLPRVATALLAAFSPAQDFLGYTFSGVRVGLDSHPGVEVFISTSSPLGGAQAMARIGGKLYVATSSFGGLPFPASQFHLDEVDERTYVATRILTNTGRDVRSLATAANGTLLGIVDATPSDLLVSINLVSGAINTVGPPGFAGVQAFVRHQGILYAWDITQGLLTVNPGTGVVTDVNAAVGAPVDVQFLASMSDGRLLGGRNALYVISPGLGTTTLVGSGTWSDLRGAEEHFGRTLSFGVSCAATSGLTQLRAFGTAYPGPPLLLQSSHHALNSVGLLCFGSSRTSYGALPLPLDVDALRG